MQNKDKEILKSIAEGIKDMEEENKEYLLGIGEGLRLARKREQEKEKNRDGQRMDS